MRVSPAGIYAKTLDEAEKLATSVTEVTHNHPEGIKGAKAVAASIFMSEKKASKSEIKDYVSKKYYPLDFLIDEIRDFYSFDESCQNTVPQAIKCFLESTSFEHSLRLSISIGGDSDTVAAISSSIAGAYYGIPEDMKKIALTYLDDYLKSIYDEWSSFSF
jgi:type I restriction enzyme M protein